MRLTPEQGRVLGSLVEKQLTTPQQYPLTDNALVAACNQSTNRDPVVQYDVATARVAVRSLRERELVRTVHRTGERSEKHRHLLDTALGLSPAAVALLAVLLLRGPQTPGELRARTERMHPFGSGSEVEQVLSDLASRDEPLVARLERQPGHKEIRFVELLVQRDPFAVVLPARPAQPTATPNGRPTPISDVAQPAGQDLGALRDEVAQLRIEVAELRAELARLRPHDEDD